MLPRALVQVDHVGDRVVPRFLTAADHVWLRRLVVVAEASRGLPVGRLDEALRSSRCASTHGGKWAMAAHVVARLLGREPVSAAPHPRELRAAVFQAAQQSRDAVDPPDRARILERVGELHGLGADGVEQRLFADLPAARRVGSGALPDLAELALQVNLALVQGLLQYATELTLEVHGGAHPLIRQVRLRRLLCTVEGLPRGARLQLSGAYSLFRRTRLYGNRLASLLPALGRCERWSLRARIQVDGADAVLELDQHDPLLPSAPGPGHDSKVERWFERDWARVAPAWDLVREPAPLPAGDQLIFPDFEVRSPEGVRWLLEIVGFWTPDYLQRKVQGLEASGVRNLLLCVDQSLACEEGELPAHWRVLRYRRRVDAAAVLQALEAGPPVARQEVIGLPELFIDYAGRQPPASEVHTALGALGPGSPLRLGRAGGRVELQVGETVVAVLSRRAAERWRSRVGEGRAARVVRMASRRASQSHPDWRWRLAVGEWLVPVVEVLGGAGGGGV